LEKDQQGVSKIGRMLGEAERKLDEYGKPAWIAAMVAGFVLVWPLGLAILGYMIWSGRMGWGCRRGEGRRDRARSGSGTTGNTAFDAYREATLKRLEEERAAFSDFLDRLRRAKDQAEFEQFMDQRNRPAPAAGPEGQPA
jgi:hypothetical protein